jgi:hypothetical protein
MRTTTKLAFACALLLVSPLWGRTYTTAFPTPPAPENPISEGNNWINGGVAGGASLWGNVQTTAGQAYGVSEPATYGDPTAVLTGSWGTTQTAEAVVKINTTPTGCCHEVELRLRSTIVSNSLNGYELNCSVTAGFPYIQLVRWNGPNGSYNQLDQLIPAQPCVNGDVLKFSVTGPAGATTFQAWLNGAALTFSTCHCTNPVDTSGIATGTPGMGFYNNNDSNWIYFGFSSFTATDGISTPATPAQITGAVTVSGAAAVK